jgi:hypothetical protein
MEKVREEDELGGDGSEEAVVWGKMRRRRGSGGSVDPAAPHKPKGQQKKAAKKLIFGALLPREVVALKKRFTAACENSGTTPQEGLKKKPFKVLVRELCREVGDGGHVPSSQDLEQAFELADEDEGGTVRASSLVQRVINLVQFMFVVFFFQL